MFKHLQVMVTVADVSGPGRTGPARPAATPARTDLATARTHIDQEFQRVAGPDHQLDRQAFINDRLDHEGLAGAQREQRQQQLEQEFASYDHDHNNQLSAAEFASLVEDHVQAGQGYDMGQRGAAGDLSQADTHALNQGITERGAQVLARQRQLNDWLGSPQGHAWASSDAGRQALGEGGRLAEDSKEGPRTRAVMQAMAAAQAPAQPAAGAAPVANAVHMNVHDDLVRADHEGFFGGLFGSRYNDVRRALGESSSPADFNAVAASAAQYGETGRYADTIRAIGAAPTPAVREALRDAYANASNQDNVETHLAMAMQNPNATAQDVAAIRAVVNDLHEHRYTRFTDQHVIEAVRARLQGQA